MKTAFRNFTQVQRLIGGIALSVWVLVVFLHNPISGYTTSSETTVAVTTPLEPCSDQDREEYRSFLTDFYNSEMSADQRRFAEQLGGVSQQIDRRVNNCHLLKPGLQTDSSYQPGVQTVVTHHPFSQWHTNSPLFSWFGVLIHAIYSMLATVIVAAVFICFVFPAQAKAGE